jgi:hypothetical protein
MCRCTSYQPMWRGVMSAIGASQADQGRTFMPLVRRAVPRRNIGRDLVRDPPVPSAGDLILASVPEATPPSRTGCARSTHPLVALVRARTIFIQRQPVECSPDAAASPTAPRAQGVPP